MKVLIITSNDYGWGAAAAAFLRDYSSKIEAVSASCSQPNSKDSLVKEAMHECLINLEDETTLWNPEVNPQSFDVVMNLEETYPCPSSIEEARRIRDDIKNTFFLWLRAQGKIE